MLEVHVRFVVERTPTFKKFETLRFLVQIFTDRLEALDRIFDTVGGRFVIFLKEQNILSTIRNIQAFFKILFEVEFGTFAQNTTKKNYTFNVV